MTVGALGRRQRRFFGRVARRSRLSRPERRGTIGSRHRYGGYSRSGSNRRMAGLLELAADDGDAAGDDGAHGDDHQGDGAVEQTTKRGKFSLRHDKEPFLG